MTSMRTLPSSTSETNDWLRPSDGSSQFGANTLRGLGIWRIREEPARAWQRVGNLFSTPPEEIAQVRLPPAGAREFRLSCIFNCITTTSTPPAVQLQPSSIIFDLSTVLFWHDPATGQLTASTDARRVQEAPGAPIFYQINTSQALGSPLMIETGRITFVMDSTVVRASETVFGRGSLQVQLTRIPTSVMD